MGSNGMISLGFFSVSCVALVITMALSTAEFVEFSIFAAAVTLILTAFGFVFAHRNKQDEDALMEGRITRKGRSSTAVKKAMEALEDYETAQSIHEAPEIVAEKREKAVQTALEAVRNLRGIGSTPRILAIAATDKAIRSQAQLQLLLSEEASEEEILLAQSHAEEDALSAITEIRRMLLVKRDGYLNEELE